MGESKKKCKIGKKTIIKGSLLITLTLLGSFTSILAKYTMINNNEPYFKPTIVVFMEVFFIF